jgi:hypothetical protein
MRLWIALLVSTIACGGKTSDPRGAPGEPGDPTPVPTHMLPLNPRPWTQNPGGTIVFEPTLVQVTRYPNVCGVMNPPFENGDSYWLEIADQTGQTPYAELDLNFISPAPAIGTPLVLGVNPFMPPAAQDAQAGGVTFQYSPGTNAGEIDAGAFDAATVTFLAMPTVDGQPLTVRIQVRFVDGRTLDETFSSAPAPAYSGCTAG